MRCPRIAVALIGFGLVSSLVGCRTVDCACADAAAASEERHHITDEVRFANLDVGEHCGAEVGFCRPGLICRVSEQGADNPVCHDDRVGIGEVCGTFSNIKCQDGAYCQLESEGFDVRGVCKSVYKEGAPEG